jgi:hypothetical protein
MGIQFRNRVEAALGVSLSVVDFLKGLSLHQLVENTVTALEQPEGPLDQVAVDASPSIPTSLTAEGVEKLTERELDTLLHSLLH